MALAITAVAGVASAATCGEDCPFGYRLKVMVRTTGSCSVTAQSACDEFIPEAQHVHVISDAEVASDLIFLDVYGTDDNDDFGIVFHLKEHLELAVRLKSRQDAAGMVVVKQLPAELHVKFVTELRNPLLDVLGLDLQIFLVVEPVLHK